MKPRINSAACTVFVFVLTLLLLPSGQPRAAAADVISVYGINAGRMVGSYVEDFQITVDAQRRTATATEPDFFTVRYSRGGAILVQRANYYYGYHAGGFFDVYKRGNRNNDVLFNARAVSGYSGFQQGVADISGDDTHLWVNPYDGSNLLFEFVPAPEDALGWKVEKRFTLRNASDHYDGMEVVGEFIYANRRDAGFNPMSTTPCNSLPNGIYDKYSKADGSLVMAAFISTTFPASGIAFNGTYFFISDICNNGIAVYASDGTFIAEATLPLPLPDRQTSLCVNTMLMRCVEDFSILQSSSDSSEARRQTTTTSSESRGAPAD